MEEQQRDEQMTGVVADRVAVLLGAGASRDAGLPLTSDLAAAVLKRANEEVEQYNDDWRRSLNFVYGAMVGHQSENGSNALQSVNIEKLISALRLLQERETHEVAPFVASWKAGATGVPSRESLDGSQIGGALQYFMERGEFFARSKLASAFGALAREAVLGGSSDSFMEAERNVLKYLSEILSKPSSVDYLSPLIKLAKDQPGGLDAITLNYDLTLETACAAHDGVSLDRGIERWKPGTALTFRQEHRTLNLMKLHGSLDWQLGDAADDSGIDPPTIHVTPGEAATHPWIVVGDREKLSKDGPILALMRAAEQALTQATHLVVIGYSFADRHINALIRDWLLGSSYRTITVVDPTLRPQWRWDFSNFRDALIERYGSWTPTRQDKNLISDDANSVPRLLAVPEAAALALAHVLTDRPSAYPDTFAEVTADREGADLRISLTLLGGAVGRSDLTLTDIKSGQQIPGRIPDSEYENFPMIYMHVDSWKKGQEIIIHTVISDATESVKVTLRAASFGLSIVRSVKVDVPGS